ncbi:GNAT family N-acetyltransferase [Halocynthiibacter sp. C4]|uniref:GNAT family N-acetyltransferase n=1 Tax=Halocynthiibacter sp. C4 TaxID=2992758 RepID=UPI00237A6454|nr:GNAT family N-acetyltransferase [Halocynthiibacter sp. C4]MDE0589730.1 GNAT family N-acetyltransferase [Halocynthiibacter sp. C4]
MTMLKQGRYQARLAKTSHDIAAAQELRHRAFFQDEAQRGLDQDEFDEKCSHVLVSDLKTGRLVCCFRMMELADGRGITNSYAAQYYELSALADFDGPIVEMGRFCVDPSETSPDILRVAWGAMTEFVDSRGVQLLFGCSSFKGTEAEAYYDAFAMLKDRHLAPKRWLPKVKAPDVFRFAQRLRRKPDPKRAMRSMPPLLKTYLAMGGWVSDHAVIDPVMNTLHVFTGLEIGAIPPARRRFLQAATR